MVTLGRLSQSSSFKVKRTNIDEIMTGVYVTSVSAQMEIKVWHEQRAFTPEVLGFICNIKME
jgi:hypothetical protein